MPVGPAGPAGRRWDAHDGPRGDVDRTRDDLEDAQAPTFAADTMRILKAPLADERARFVGHGEGRQHFAPPPERGLRAPESVGHRVGPTPAASPTLPPWASTSATGRAANASSAVSPAAAAAPDIVVRIELVLVDQTQQAFPPIGTLQTDAETTPALLQQDSPQARSSAPVRAAVRIVGVLALVGIGLFLVQLGAWLAR